MDTFFCDNFGFVHDFEGVNFSGFFFINLPNSTEASLADNFLEIIHSFAIYLRSTVTLFHRLCLLNWFACIGTHYYKISFLIYKIIKIAINHVFIFFTILLCKLLAYWKLFCIMCATDMFLASFLPSFFHTSSLHFDIILFKS